MILVNGTLYLHKHHATARKVFHPVSLDTLIVQNLLKADPPERSCGACALVLLGGVLKALATMLAAHGPAADTAGAPGQATPSTA